MQATIVLLPGDGIGEEVIAAARKVLETVADRFGHAFNISEHLVGGCAIDATGTALPEATLQACLQADAVLMGAVGGPKWDDPTAPVRPEQGLLGLRKNMGLFANLRPVRPHPALLKASPLRAEHMEAVDLLIVRELTGGIYFGEPRLRQRDGDEWIALDTLIYRESEVRRIAHIAFGLAQDRRKKVCSVDKANVLESSRLWRQIVSEIAPVYPDVELEHVLVDAAAMYLVTQASRFDVLLTTNMFGDILSDEAAVLAGSMGNLPSASLGEAKNRLGLARGLFEPVHGSAPDIAGTGKANPIGAILSLAMLLRHSLGLMDEALAVEKAVDTVLSAGKRTVDLALPGEPVHTTSGIGDIIGAEILN